MGWQRPLKGPFTRAARLAGLVVATVAVILAAAFLLLPLAVPEVVAHGEGHQR